MTRAEIIEAMHHGTRVANKRYERWTRGWWLHDSGVEGLLVAGIAEAVNKRQEPHESLLLEASYGYIVDRSGADIGRGSPAEMPNEGNRADLVLFNGNERPICIIEVKRFWSNEKCLEDLRRIHSLVDTCSHQSEGSLRRGFLAVMIAKGSTAHQTPETKIEKQLCQIRQTVSTEFEKSEQNIRFHLSSSWTLPVQYRETFGPWQGSSFCIELSSRTLR